MKRSMSLVVVAAIAILLLGASPSQANLITNPSWETGDTSGWTQTFNVFVGPATVLTDTRALDGTHMLGGTFPDDATNNGYVQYEDRTTSVQFAANSIYTWTAYAFTDNPNLTGTLRLVIGSSPTDGGARDTNWVDQTLNFSAGAGTVLAPDGITLWNEFTATLDTAATPGAVGLWAVPTFDLENAYMDQAIFIPEPTTIGLMATGGLLALAAVVRRRLRR